MRSILLKYYRSKCDCFSRKLHPDMKRVQIKDTAIPAQPSVASRAAHVKNDAENKWVTLSLLKVLQIFSLLYTPFFLHNMFLCCWFLGRTSTDLWKCKYQIYVWNHWIWWNKNVVTLVWYCCLVQGSPDQTCVLQSLAPTLIKHTWTS